MRIINVYIPIEYLGDERISTLNECLNAIVYPEGLDCPEYYLPKFENKLNYCLNDLNYNDHIDIFTSSDHIVNYLRHYVFKHPETKVTISYKDEIIKITPEGLFDYKGENGFPKGFYDATLKKMFEINRGK